MMQLIAVLLLLPLAIAAPRATVRVYFSPKGGAESAYVALIASAKTQIRAEAYSFTSQPIATALISAKQRGVDVRLIVDPTATQALNQRIDSLAAAGVPVLVDAKHAIFHDKCLVVDSRYVATGSFNLTTQAEHSNAENSLFLSSPELARAYLDNWNLHAAHSTAYATPTSARNHALVNRSGAILGQP